ncbi:WD40-repeat-containing domain protein [Umbelopsis sp. PMI_123]|nr:WD40-repeat-containing domain protein [Umbelopsis sp. PMI_123]
MQYWTNEQKAEFAYQILLTVPTSGVLAVVERLTPLLHRDLLVLLPYEVSLHILSFTDINTLAIISRVSRQWRKLSQDQLLWRKMYLQEGWGVDLDAIKRYIEGEIMDNADSQGSKEADEEEMNEICIQESSTRNRALTTVPLARTTAPLYNPSAVPTMPGAPQTSRLRSLRRPGELLTRLRQRRSSPLTPSVIPTAPRIMSSSTSLPTRMNVDTLDTKDEDNDDMEIVNNKHEDSEESIYAIHQHPVTGARIINWKYLYQQRYLLEQRWKTGHFQVREISSNPNRPESHTAGIYCIQFDDEKIVSGSRDHTVKIWDMQTGTCIRTLWQHTASVLCLQYDDRFIISGSSDKTIKQWDIHTGELIRSLNGHSESVLNLRFDKNYIVSCSKDRTVRVWSVHSGSVLRRLVGHRAAVNACQFKDNLIVSASGDRTIKLWDLETGACLRTFDSHSRGIACVQFDGRIIASGSSDQTIKIWDVATGECTQTLTGHSNLVRTVQFDTRNDRIVSGSYDETIKIWSMKRGQPLHTLRDSLQSKVFRLQFNDTKIVCCSNNPKIVIYDFGFGIDTTFFA